MAPSCFRQAIRDSSASASNQLRSHNQTTPAVFPLPFLTSFNCWPQSCRPSDVALSPLCRLLLDGKGILQLHPYMPQPQRTFGSTAIQRSYIKASRGSKGRKLQLAIKIIGAKLTPFSLDFMPSRQLITVPSNPIHTLQVSIFQLLTISRDQCCRWHKPKEGWRDTSREASICFSQRCCERDRSHCFRYLCPVRDAQLETRCFSEKNIADAYIGRRWQRRALKRQSQQKYHS